MAMPSTENSDQPVPLPNDADHLQDNTASNSLNHGGAEPKPGIAEEEIRGILEVIASTGKFWYGEVLSEYPEAKMTSEGQNASLGETYPELVKRLDEALHSFDEGPPFTLQRLCEILLAARSIYPNLSKAALALEKNLLVTSTLTVCTDPYPQAMQKPDEVDKACDESQLQPSSTQNGVQPMVGDGDEIMAEVQEADIDDDMTIDMEAFEEIVGSSEPNPTPTENS